MIIIASGSGSCGSGGGPSGGARRLTLLPLFLIFSAITASVWGFPLVNSSDCDCYQTNATTSSSSSPPQYNYFRRHAFFDFRGLSAHAGVPPLAASPEAAAAAPPASDYFSGENPWADTWSVQNWNNSDAVGGDATLLMVNSASNVYISRDSDSDSDNSDTYLVLRTARVVDGFQSAAEVQSVSSAYRFLSLRMCARTVGAPGAVTAMFTYLESEELADVQESDLEILTGGPDYSIQYTNQPSYNATSDIPQATRNVSLPGTLDWGQWEYHRLDWTPGVTEWSVNGARVASIDFQTPTSPLEILFNAWSDGGSWSGVMDVGDSAELQIRWIEFVYNTTADDGDGSSSRPVESCANVCSIDETPEIGTPVLLAGSVGPVSPSATPTGSSSAAQTLGVPTAFKILAAAGKSWGQVWRSVVAGTRPSNSYPL
ncbi:carbohydrate-binding module family 1 protein [Xylariaceae sp. FL0804]|nr:carbohydrate-binding module family 1 protein [Xylariaceae sp. FL0804]